MTLAAALHTLDWAVLGLYLALLVGAGVLLSRRAPASADDYFLAQRRMPVWAVAISLLATIQSAATFVGVPEQSYTGDLRYLSATIGALIAAAIFVRVFLPIYYRQGLATPYELLRRRFGPAAHGATAATYLIGRIMASGARIYLGAVPFAIAIFGRDEPADLAWIIAGFVLFGVLFTLAGGVRAAIWTDVLQVGVYLGAAVAILIALLAALDLPLGTLWSALRSPPDRPSKLTVLPLSTDPGQEFTLWTALTGFALLNLAALATDQDLTQRTLTCRSSARAAWSVLGGTLVGIPVVLVFLAIGLLLHVYYHRPDLTGVDREVQAVGGSTRVLVNFALTQMPAGMAGLMLAGLLAAGPAGINGSLNAMASALINDVYRPRRPQHLARLDLLAGRLAVAFFGVALGGFAVVCAFWRDATGQTMIGFALSVMVFAYAGLLGVFLAALLTRRGSAASAIAGLAAGAAVVAAMHKPVWAAWTAWTPWTNEHLAPLHIAYPWHLVAGTIIAFATCCLGRGSPRAEATTTTTTHPAP